MVNIRKYAIANFLILLIISQTFLDSSKYFSTAQSPNYKAGMNPGMILRLDQRTINSFKKAMERFLPDYLNVDMRLPHEYHYSFGFLFDLFVWQIDWTQIKYKDIDLDVSKISIDLKRTGDSQLISVKVPALKHWEVDALQNINFWFIPDISTVQLIFKDFKFDFDTDFRLDEHGYLDPIVKKCDISFGESYLYHDNPIVGFFMHQFIYFGMVIIENASYFVGDQIFSNMMGPVLDNFLNHYQLPFYYPSLIRGQYNWDLFTLDYRNTRSPTISPNGFIDLFFSGELIYKKQACPQFQNGPIDFLNPNFTLSQIVVSENLATCWANQFAKSSIGQIYLDTRRVNLFRGFNGSRFDTSNFGDHIPLFKHKLGERKILSANISFKDIKVLFGQFDSDVILDYTLQFKVFKGEATNDEIFYDELKMITSLSVKADDDIVYINILKNKLDVNSKYLQRTLPMRNKLNITTNEYKEFISTFGFFMSYMRTYLNNVYFKHGIKFPYNPDEIYTAVIFNKGQMHILLDLLEDADKFFKAELWNENQKQNAQLIRGRRIISNRTIT